MPRLSYDLRTAQMLSVLDLYCGCGGLSFIEQHTEDVVVETRWAVDHVPSMCETYGINYPSAKVGAPRKHCHCGAGLSTICIAFGYVHVSIARYPAWLSTGQAQSICVHFFIF